MEKKFPEVIAHRGFKTIAPENTIVAFSKAIELDVDGIELDVHLSKDKRIVVIHDETLQRTTNGSGYVKDFNYNDFKKLDAGSWFSAEYKREKIPMLEEVFELLKDSKKILNIELKNSIVEYEDIERMVIDMIVKYTFQEHTIISSFNHYSLRKVKAIKPEIRTAILCNNITFELLEYMKKYKANDIHINVLALNKELLNCCKANGIKLRCFTVNAKSDMKKLVQIGVDGIITDYPDVLLGLKKS